MIDVCCLCDTGLFRAGWVLRKLLGAVSLTAPSSFLCTSRLQAMMLLSCSCANGFLSNMSADRSLQSEGCRGFKQLFSPQVISCLNLFDTCD